MRAMLPPVTFKLFDNRVVNKIIGDPLPRGTEAKPLSKQTLLMVGADHCQPQIAQSQPTDDNQVAQWLPATTGVGTLLAAIIAAVYANGAFRLESGRDERWVQAQERAQAEQVAAWGQGNGDVSGGFGARTFDNAFCEYWAVNASTVPVYDVVVTIEFLIHTGQSGDPSTDTVVNRYKWLAPTQGGTKAQRQYFRDRSIPLNGDPRAGD